MNVSLTPRLEKLVQKKVASGMYNSASEVVREALRLLQQHDRLRELRMKELRKEIQIGVRQYERGEHESIEEHGLSDFFDGVRAAGREALRRSRSRRRQ